ncbi:Sortase domain protein [anaerobic digester metagenome]
MNRIKKKIRGGSFENHEHDFIPPHSRNLSRNILQILMALCLMGIIGSAGVLWLEDLNEQAAIESYAQIQMAVGVGTGTNDASTINTSDSLKQRNLAMISESCPNAMGWIRVTGTNIDYPVAQGKDNAYYLKHLITGEPNKMGAIFLDHRNAGFTDRLSVIYGHHLKNGTMFSDLERFKDADFFAQTPVIQVQTKGDTFRFKAFAVLVLPGEGNDLLQRYHELGEQSFMNWIWHDALLQAKGIWTPGDSIIALSTCSYEFDNARTVVFGTPE